MYSLTRHGGCLSTDRHPVSCQSFPGVPVAVPPPVHPSHSHHLKGPLLLSCGSSSFRSLGLPSSPLVPPWGGAGSRNSVCILSLGPAAALLLPESHTAVHRQHTLGFSPTPPSSGVKTSPQVWLRVSPSSIPLIFLSLHLFLSAPTHCSFSVHTSQKFFANQLLQTGTCRVTSPDL